MQHERHEEVTHSFTLTENECYELIIALMDMGVEKEHGTIHKFYNLLGFRNS